MYIISQGNQEALKKDGVLGMFFKPSEEVIEKTVRYEFWGTNFNDTGGDYTELILFDTDDNEIYRKRVAGY